ncbi:hypothetical protein HDU76_005151 [Blyttiomyces sp. JEL0837]|nr:hypothetical protein HDU76_005151 [Blyttiomyces sp. JEL0837]
MLMQCRVNFEINRVKPKDKHSNGNTQQLSHSFNILRQKLGIATADKVNEHGVSARDLIERIVANADGSGVRFGVKANVSAVPTVPTGVVGAHSVFATENGQGSMPRGDHSLVPGRESFAGNAGSDIGHGESVMDVEQKVVESNEDTTMERPSAIDIEAATATQLQRPSQPQESQQQQQQQRQLLLLKNQEIVKKHLARLTQNSTELRKFVTGLTKKVEEYEIQLINQCVDYVRKNTDVLAGAGVGASRVVTESCSAVIADNGGSESVSANGVRDMMLNKVDDVVDIGGSSHGLGVTEMEPFGSVSLMNIARNTVETGKSGDTEVDPATGQEQQQQQNQHAVSSTCNEHEFTTFASEIETTENAKKGLQSIGARTLDDGTNGAHMVGSGEAGELSGGDVIMSIKGDDEVMGMISTSSAAYGDSRFQEFEGGYEIQVPASSEGIKVHDGARNNVSGKAVSVDAVVPAVVKTNRKRKRWRPRKVEKENGKENASVPQQSHETRGFFSYSNVTNEWIVDPKLAYLDQNKVPVKHGILDAFPVSSSQNKLVDQAYLKTMVLEHPVFAVSLQVRECSRLEIDYACGMTHFVVCVGGVVAGLAMEGLKGERIRGCQLDFVELYWMKKDFLPPDFPPVAMAFGTHPSAGMMSHGNPVMVHRVDMFYRSAKRFREAWITNQPLETAFVGLDGYLTDDDEKTIRSRGDIRLRSMGKRSQMC